MTELNLSTRSRRPSFEVAMNEPQRSDSSQRRLVRTWRDKFRDAFRGLKLGVRGQTSFFAHFFFAALVIAAAIALRCGVVEWCILLFCIGLVLTAEMANSAIETLFKGLDEKTRSRAHPALDVSAAAVLFAALTAAVVGLIIFGYRLAVLLELGGTP
jgi:diacylglycerol kinase